MELEIRPEPREQVRRAIAAALAQLERERGSDADGGAWWRAGTPGADDDDRYAGARRRSSPGADRA